MRKRQTANPGLEGAPKSGNVVEEIANTFLLRNSCVFAFTFAKSALSPRIRCLLVKAASSVLIGPSSGPQSCVRCNSPYLRGSIFERCHRLASQARRSRLHVLRLDKLP
jgi:hypothetical protein